VNALAGKSAGHEVMIQGKQMKVIVDFLIAKGVPKRWIETTDLTGTGGSKGGKN
jgi:translation initiation factor 2D